MVIKGRAVCLLAACLSMLSGLSQITRSTIQKSIVVKNDTIQLDSLTLVTGSASFTFFPSGDFHPVVSDGRLWFTGRKPDSVQVKYQRYAVNFSKPYYHRDASALYRDRSRPGNPFAIQYDKSNKSQLFANDGLIKNGNISRGITFGNNQDVVVNSNLNLQASGKLTPDIDLVMAATDNNIPFQPDGTTAQLQEFDKVYVQLSGLNSKMIVGDYQLSKPQNSYFMNFYKRSQGLYIENLYTDSSFRRPVTFKTQVAGAVSKGKFARQVFYGTESNQGPYRLKGANNELFIIVLSGTERIYIDGKLLTRGQENDYIIDYNSGEITFTARQLITKDKRIVAEFQYAERNYSRSLFFAGEELSTTTSKTYFDFYSEQDNKNRPLQQTLTQDQKNVMLAVGDTLSKAYSSGAEKADFNNNEVFYVKRDTLTPAGLFPGVFIYTTVADTPVYRVRFSEVGANKGHYVQVLSSANGKVYQWVAPLEGVLQGNYEPIIPLVTPKLQQMLVAGYQQSLTPSNAFTVEGVYTRNDINLFSGRDKRNDEGTGVKLNFVNTETIKSDTSGKDVQFIYNGGYEFIQQRFTQVERFRSIEFDRDWNRPLVGVIRNDQQVMNAETGFRKKGKGELIYGFAWFSEGGSYDGKKQLMRGNYQHRGFTVNYNGSRLHSEDQVLTQRSIFYRHKSSIVQRVKRVKFSLSDEFENNAFRRIGNDSLLNRAYQFWEWEGSIGTADSGKTNARVYYKERRDQLSHGDRLHDSTFARNVGMQASFFAVRNHPVIFYFNYRVLELRNIVGTALQPDNTFLSRLEYNPRLWKGFITAGLFYETGFGLENKKEYYYLEVAPGQGQYTWNDYNGNGIKELNEFEVSQFSDKATYIRVYTPTNKYVKVLQNQLSISLNVRPAAIMKKGTRLHSFAGKWSLQTAFRIDNKISDTGKDQYNPFAVVNDTLLLGSNNNLRQSVFFNQGSAIFGADYTYLNNLGRQLLTNGIEQKSLESHELKWRFNFFKAWSINSINSTSDKGNRSKFFETRNYLIRAYETEQRLIYQPTTTFRLSFIGKLSDKKNHMQDVGEKATLRTLAVEGKFNQTEKGSVTGRIDFIQITYLGDNSSSVAYEMLNGLSPGDNYTWELTYQRNITSSIQLSINYNGRKPAGSKVVHIGGAQVRAFF